MSRLPHLLALVSAMLVASAHAVTVRLTAADGAHVQVALQPGDILRVDLPSEPASGRSWSVVGRTNPRLLALGAAQRVFGGRMSDQGTSSFAWRALTAGEADLSLVYGTASARADKPEKTVAVHLTIAGEPLGPEEAHPTPVSQLEQVAAYTRTSPCGDCRAIAERLLLYRSPAETPYVLRRVYQDAPGGTLTSVSTGRWSTHPGNSADPSATIYALAGPSETSLYRLEGDRLLQVDAQQVPIPAPPGMDTAFHKLPAE